MDDRFGFREILFDITLRRPLLEFGERIGGRVMGLARQSVQRLADILVGEGLACYEDNPAHKSAKLLSPTAQGRDRIARLSGRQTEWANKVSHGVDPASLTITRDMLMRLVYRVETTDVPA